MRRLLPLLALALLPAAVAAPVPRDARTPFGYAGLLDAADLEKVHFDSRPAKAPDDIDEVKGAKPLELVKEPPGKVRPKNRYDVAVHLPWATFHEGESVRAYFVLRNNRAQVFGMPSRIDLTGTEPRLRGGSCVLDVRDRATGKSVIESLSMSTNCGGGYMAEVPADGFYCVAADLNRAAGRMLPPGEYEVDWRYGALVSAPVIFTVSKGDGAKPPKLAKRGGLHFLRLAAGEDDPEYPAKAGAPLAWRDAELEDVGAEDIAAALAVGPGGVYAPDVRALPASDKLVEARVEWRPYRDGDRVVVTLRAVPPHERVAFAEMPQLHLQVETPDTEDARRRELMKGADKKQHEREELVTPLTVEARLPIGWREHAGATGAARVAVLVTAKPLELPRGGRGLDKVPEKVDKVEREPAGGARPPVWAGIVRTEATELRFPPPVVIAKSTP